MAWGTNKALAIQKSIEGNTTEEVPASILQEHDDTLFVTDEAAAADLIRFKTPWLTGDCDWNKDILRKAVVSTALKLGKPILSLTDNDYNDHGLSDLLAVKGDAYEINLEVFYMLRDSITGWPGGEKSAFAQCPGKDEPLS